jgi:hypothetical protein
MNILPDLQSCIICEDVRREMNGKLMLIGVIPALIVPKLPCKLDRLHIVTSLCCGQGEFEISTRIYKPDQTTIFLQNEKSNHVKMQDTNTLATIVQCFINPTFTESGIYWVEVLVEKQLKLRFPFPVNVKTLSQTE